jgi:hypothetical protein
MKTPTLVGILVACCWSCADLRAQEPLVVQPKLTYDQPFPVKTDPNLPTGWQLTELPGSRLNHGPYKLSNGYSFGFDTPYYVLTPIYERNSVYIYEPGFDPTQLKGDPKVHTLPTILKAEMEDLRSTSEQLSTIAGNIRQLRMWLQSHQVQPDPKQAPEPSNTPASPRNTPKKGP